ncbi:MAG TPA: oligosaccharide flippase family protein [Thermoplasmata archaeon]|nr:oligosaccharide flippase family protein [Thermoplasmata archaeon]
MAASGPATGATAPPVAVPKQAFSLALSSGAVFAVSLLVQLIGYAGNVLLQKHFGVNNSGLALLGTAQFFLLIASSINGIGDLRLGTAYTYFLARGKSATDNTTTYLFARTAMVGVVGLVLFVIAPTSIAGGQIASPGVDLEAFGLFISLPIFWSFSTVYNQMFIGQGNSLKAQYPSLVEATVRLPVLFYVAYYNPTILGITFAYMVGAASSAVYSLPAVWKHLSGWRSSEATRMFRFAWPLMASLMLNYLVTNTVPLLIKIGVSAAAFSVFLIANGWRVLVLSLPGAVTTPLFPYFAGLHRQERYEAIRTGTWQALRYSAMLLVPGVVALVVYRYNFLNVFATTNVANQGSLALALLAVGAVPLALSQIIQSSINAIGRQRLELYITSTQIMVLLAGLALLMPPWGPLQIHPGIVAGSVAILASSFAALAMNSYFMETLIRVHIRPISIGGITASAAGAFSALYLLNHYHLFPVSSSYQLFAAVLIGFTVYFFVLAGIGELTQEDVRRIGTSLGLPRRLVAGAARIPWRKRNPDLPPVDLARAPGLRSTELPETFTGNREMPEISTLPEEVPPPEDSKNSGPLQ